MDNNKLRDFKESQLTKEFFEILRKKREITKEAVVNAFEAGKSVSRDDIANDVIYMNGYAQCLEDIVNIDNEVINDIINQYQDKVKSLFDPYTGFEFNRPNDPNKTN